MAEKRVFKMVHAQARRGACIEHQIAVGLGLGPEFVEGKGE